MIRRLVVKIGSAVVAPGGRPDPDAFKRLAGGIAEVTRRGVRVVVVSSGAVASGFRALGLDAPPRQISRKQAAAAIGQHKLMSLWATAFATHGLDVAQVLYTADDLNARPRFLNARRTLLELLDAGVIPIVNENDSVSFAEIRLGDNDRLSALTAGLVGAELLLILSSVPGLLRAADSQVIPVIEDPADAVRHIRAETTSVGTGGMTTKIEAAAIASGWGIPTVIAAGASANVAARVLDGEPIGTYFRPASRPRKGRKRWIESSAPALGVIHVDAGCAAAMLKRGASLLPSGITAVDGTFARGAVVCIVGPKSKRTLARGVVAYTADELRAIRGRRGADIAATLGYCYCDEAIHRDDLVVYPTGTDD